jgi:MFS family permease
MPAPDPANLSSEKHDPYAAFRFAPFRLYAVSYVLAVISSQILVTASIWQVHVNAGGNVDVTSALKLALFSLVQALPTLGLAVVAGQVVDRVNRRSLLLVTQVVLTLCPAVLALFGWLGQLSSWSIYPIVFINGVALAFARPARQTMLPTLVPRVHYTNAVTWTSTLFETSTVVGPLFAGYVMWKWSPTAALAISAACMGSAFLLALFFPNPGKPLNDEPPSFRSAMAGFRFMHRNKVLWAAANLDLWAVLLGGATILLPMFATRLGVGEGGFGAFRAALAAGALGMALVQAHLPPFRHAGRVMLMAVALFGLCMIVFGVSESFWLSLAMLAIAGAADNVSVVIRHSLVNLLTPDPMRGRVLAANQVFIGASNDIGNLEAALVAALIGPVGSVVLGGIGTIVVVGYIAMRYPQVRQLGALRDVEPVAEPTRVT